MKIDEIKWQVQNILNHGDARQKLLLIESFVDRFDGGWHFSFEPSLRHDVINFKFWKQADEVYDGWIRGNRINLGPRFGSHIDICEMLGVPVNYIVGLLDGMEVFRTVHADYLANHEQYLESQREKGRKHLNAFESHRKNSRKLRDFIKGGLDKVAHIDTASYPDVPTKICPVPVDEKSSWLPSVPGVYFVWDEEAVQYVGQSVRLSGRVTVGHESINPGDMVSFMTCEYELLDFAECHYIGACKPKRNFNSSAKWKGKKS
jgi:hypothetical protein